MVHVIGKAVGKFHGDYLLANKIAANTAIRNTLQEYLYVHSAGGNKVSMCIFHEIMFYKFCT